MPDDMQTVRFYADQGTVQVLHVETEGAIVNIRVGLTDAEGRRVTSVQVSPDDESRGGDGNGRVWHLADDGCRIIRQPHPDDAHGADRPDGSGSWSLVATVPVSDDQLDDIAELIKAGHTSGDVPGADDDSDDDSEGEDES